MTGRTISLLTFTFLLMVNKISGQVTVLPVDTVKIYKNKTGIRYNKYFHFWFFINNSECSWNPKRVNKQDSLVIEEHPPRYFKVYNFNEKLLLEGQTIGGTEFQGDVKFYYKKGCLKRIEHWDNAEYKDSCGSAIFHDAPGQEGTWKFFRRNGTLKKTYEYKMKIFSCQPAKFGLVRQTTKYRRNGKIKQIRIQKAD